MKKISYLLFSTLVLCTCFLYGCSKEDPLGRLKKLAPIFENAKIIESKVADGKMGIITMEVEANKATQKEILDFYKSKMTDQGWTLKSYKDYGKDGSVMELVKENVGTLSVVTIMKNTEKTGKIPVTLNLTVI